MLDVTGRLAVIVGGGAVAARKASGLIEAGAGRVRCVAPQFPGDFPAAVEKVAERYEQRHLEGAGLVFAATDSAEVNDAVVRDARARGVLVSRADAGEGRAGDFATPAVLRRSAVTVTVSAGSPALAARVRDGLAARWDERWSRMAEAMQQLRPALIRAGAADSRRRAELFRDLASEQALDVVAAGGLEELCRWLAAPPRLGRFGRGGQIGRAGAGSGTPSARCCTFRRRGPRTGAERGAAERRPGCFGPNRGPNGRVSGRPRREIRTPTRNPGQRTLVILACSAPA